MQVGGDVGAHVGKNFIDSFPDRVYASHLIPILGELKRLGEKTGRGFYKYEGRKQQKDPEIKDIMAQSAKLSGLSQVRCCKRCCTPVLDPNNDTNNET